MKVLTLPLLIYPAFQFLQILCDFLLTIVRVDNDFESECLSSLPQEATPSTSIPTNDAPLSSDEQKRLHKYLELLQTVRKGAQKVRGSAHDLLDLLARATSVNHSTTRAANLVFQEIDTNPQIHRKLRNLRTVEGD